MAPGPELEARDGCRVLLAPPYYPPDSSASTRMAQLVGERLVDAGFDVSVFSKVPATNRGETGRDLYGCRTENGMAVYRTGTIQGGTSLRRLIGGLGFAVGLVGHCTIRRHKYDVISVMTAPPVFMGVCGRLAAKGAGAKLVYHCMDIHPEVSEAIGDRGIGPLARLMRWLDQRTVESADAVIVLSDDMAKTFADRGHDNQNVVVINNFNPHDLVDLPPLEAKYQRPDGVFRFIFTGNVGRFQGLDSVLKAFSGSQVLKDSAQLCFVGDGVMTESLAAQAGDELGRSIFMWPQVSPAAAAALLADADAAVLSLVPGMLGSCYPSKTMVYLESGLPLLAVVEDDSELAQMVADAGIGELATPGDSESIESAMLRMIANRATPMDRMRSKKVGSDFFDSDLIGGKWIDLMDDLTIGRPISRDSGAN